MTSSLATALQDTCALVINLVKYRKSHQRMPFRSHLPEYSKSNEIGCNLASSFQRALSPTALHVNAPHNGPTSTITRIFLGVSGGAN